MKSSDVKWKKEYTFIAGFEFVYITAIFLSFSRGGLGWISIGIPYNTNSNANLNVDQVFSPNIWSEHGKNCRNFLVDVDKESARLSYCSSQSIPVILYCFLVTKQI